MIVLVHSGICDARMWDGFDLPGAARHELTGFGQTPMPVTGEFSWADELAATLTEPAALVGASFGGMVCLEVASTRPELVTELVLLDAPLPDHRISERLGREIPDARRVVVEGAGHLPALERQDETALLVRKFLGESQDLGTP